MDFAFGMSSPFLVEAAVTAASSSGLVRAGLVEHYQVSHKSEL